MYPHDAPARKVGSAATQELAGCMGNGAHSAHQATPDACMHMHACKDSPAQAHMGSKLRAGTRPSPKLYFRGVLLKKWRKACSGKMQRA